MAPNLAIQQAIEAFLGGEHESLREAARAYAVEYTILSRRLRGTTIRA